MRTGTLLSVAALVALAGPACAPPEIVVTAGSLPPAGFALHVVDPERDAGVGLSLAVDANGDPHLAYLVLEEPPQPGVVPPPPVPGIPGVRHAHLDGGFWTRTEVAGGVEVGSTDLTAVTVDAEGAAHVAWSAGGELWYSRTGEESERVASGTVTGPSIALGRDGMPWVAFYQDDTVKIATRTQQGWRVESVARAGDRPAPRTTAVAVAPSGLLVAYADGSRAMLARGSSRGWATKVIDEEGGAGVAMALDRDGGPHLAYVTPQGDVHHAHPGGAVALTAARLSEPAGARSAIAVGPDFVHHLAWADGGRIVYANDRTGTFEPRPVPGSEGGVEPRLAIGKDEVVYLAWYEAEDGRAEVAVHTTVPADTFLVAPPSAAPERPATPASPAAAPCEPDGAALTIAAAPGAAGTGFDRDCLAVPADRTFTIGFDNRDAGVPHNVAVYTDETASTALLVGELFPGPERRTYRGDPLEAGTYFFRCDVHPSTMTGAFVVA